MRTLYIDASNGVSGDMILHALIELSDASGAVRMWMDDVEEKIASYGSEAAAYNHHDHGHDHDHHGDGHSHRSYKEVLDIIKYLRLDKDIKTIAENIYAVIAKAESKVHGQTLEDLHFHEVGRNRAICNIVGVALCLSKLSPDAIICSEIKDGRGTVKCAHGELEVPVPAVKAMLEETDLKYSQTDREGEFVTPSGLAMLIGSGAKTGEKPEGEPYRRTEVTGMRSVDNQGMKAYLFD